MDRNLGGRSGAGRGGAEKKEEVDREIRQETLINKPLGRGSLL